MFEKWCKYISFILFIFFFLFCIFWNNESNFSFLNINFSNLRTSDIKQILKEKLNNINLTNNNVNDLLSKKLYKDYELVNKFTTGWIGGESSIQSLGNDKYLVGTNNQGFYLLEFNHTNDIIRWEKLKKEDNTLVEDLTKSENENECLVSFQSSIKHLGNNKYLVGTYNKGFYFLEFNNITNTFKSEKIQSWIPSSNKKINYPGWTSCNDGEDVGNLGATSIIQKLGDTNKYFVSTFNRGFHLLKFDDTNNTFDIDFIKKNDGLIYQEFTSNSIGEYYSIQSLGNNYYLLGTNNKGFYLLKFDNTTDRFEINRIHNNFIFSTTDSSIGRASSIQSLGNNKYLIRTFNKGFWFFSFNKDNNVPWTTRLSGYGRYVSDLYQDSQIGSTSSIQSLGNNKYLVGTWNKGFYLLQFNDNTDVFSVEKISGVGYISHLRYDRSPAVSGTHVGANSSIQSLGNNKYLVGTYDKGFYFLKFDNTNNIFEVEKINQKVINVLEKLGIKEKIISNFDEMFEFEYENLKFKNNYDFNGWTDLDIKNFFNWILVTEFLVNNEDSIKSKPIKENSKFISSRYWIDHIEQTDETLKLKDGMDYTIYKSDLTKNYKLICKENIQDIMTIDFIFLQYINNFNSDEVKKTYETFAKWIYSIPLIYQKEDLIKLAKEEKNNEDLILGINEEFDFSHTNFDNDGYLNVDELSLNKINKIIEWLNNLESKMFIQIE